MFPSLCPNYTRMFWSKNSWNASRYSIGSNTYHRVASVSERGTDSSFQMVHGSEEHKSFKPHKVSELRNDTRKGITLWNLFGIALLFTATSMNIGAFEMCNLSDDCSFYTPRPDGARPVPHYFLLYQDYEAIIYPLQQLVQVLWLLLKCTYRLDRLVCQMVSFRNFYLCHRCVSYFS